MSKGVWFSYRASADAIGMEMRVGAGQFFIYRIMEFKKEKEAQELRNEMLIELKQMVNDSAKLLNEFDGDWHEVGK